MSIKPINIVILAAGTSSMSAIDGGYPQCLTEIDDRPLLELIVERAAPASTKAYERWNSGITAPTVTDAVDNATLLRRRSRRNTGKGWWLVVLVLLLS